MKELPFHFFIFTVKEAGGKFEKKKISKWLLHMKQVAYPRYEKLSVSNPLLHKLKFT